MDNCCIDLARLEIPEGVVEIEEELVGATSLNPNTTIEEIIIPEGVKKIGQSAFANCRQLKKVHFPKSLIEIGDNAFENCELLEEIVLPKGLRIVGGYAFAGCRNLKKIEVPSKADCFVGAFMGCHAGSNGLTLINGTVYSIDCDFNNGIIEIPAGVIGISERACMCPGCVIRRLTLSDDIEYIAPDAFTVRGIEEFVLVDHETHDTVFETNRFSDSDNGLDSDDDFIEMCECIMLEDYDGLAEFGPLYGEKAEIKNDVSDDYLTMNKEIDAETKQWIISLNETMKQASVKIGSTTDEYASQYDVKKGDVVIVGVKNDSINRGEMGIVENVPDKLSVDIDEAADLAFVFSEDPNKEMIDACKKYIEDEDNVDTADEFEIFPVSYKVRKLIAASCIVAYPELSTKEDVALAKQFISQPQTLNDVPMPGPLGISRIELYESYGANSPYIGEGELYGDVFFDMEGDELKELEEDFSRKVLCETIAIMLRGGFVNLLEAFLSANPPIAGFFNEAVNVAGEAYNDKAMETLKAFDPLK